MNYKLGYRINVKVMDECNNNYLVEDKTYNTLSVSKERDVLNNQYKHQPAKIDINVLKSDIKLYECNARWATEDLSELINFCKSCECTNSYFRLLHTKSEIKKMITEGDGHWVYIKTHGLLEEEDIDLLEE